MPIRVVGVPLDLGQSRRGVDMGPSALRYAGLASHLRHMGRTVHDAGNVSVPIVEELAEIAGEPGTPFDRARHLPAILEAAAATYRAAVECRKQGEYGLFLGGDHSMSIGSISGLALNHRLGVLWVDAHGDFNTPDTTPSGNVHGMALAVLLGRGPQALVNLGHPGPKLTAQQVVMIGTRDLDPAERKALLSSGIAVFTMRDIDELGMAQVVSKALNRLAGTDSIHVSLDLDGLDPEVAPGVGTPVPGGLTFREAHLLMETLCDSGKVGSLDIVEINPILDTANTTARLAVALAGSLLGQRIL